MRFHQLVCIGIGVAVLGCAGTPGRVLRVKSDPADAEVCIKGKARSSYFSNAKSCVGSTPFEADRVEVVDGKGDKRTIKFKDVEGDQESFYLVISRPGYATQSVEVPSWEHFVALRPEGSVSTPATPASGLPGAPIPQPAPPPAEKPLEKGSVKITSEPIGVLVYLNDALKGNTPFTYEGFAGPVRLKLEMEGYNTLEKVLTVEPGKTLTVNFKMVSHKEAKAETDKARPVQTEPIKLKADSPDAH